jgi:hypothetical protein
MSGPEFLDGDKAMVKEVRSPWKSERGNRAGLSPASPPRHDGGHIAGHVGKAASSPVSLAHDLDRISAGTGNKVLRSKP